VEIVEIRDHPWFLGCQFHPEFKSRPLEPHPLFRAFIGASYAYRRQRLGSREKIQPVGAPERPMDVVASGETALKATARGPDA
jgi:hypothetical protein